MADTYLDGHPLTEKTKQLYLEDVRKEIAVQVETATALDIAASGSVPAATAIDPAQLQTLQLGQLSTQEREAIDRVTPMQLKVESKTYNGYLPFSGRQPGAAYELPDSDEGWLALLQELELESSSENIGGWSPVVLVDRLKGLTNRTIPSRNLFNPELPDESVETARRMEIQELSSLVLRHLGGDAYFRPSSRQPGVKLPFVIASIGNGVYLSVQAAIDFLTMRLVAAAQGIEIAPSTKPPDAAGLNAGLHSYTKESWLWLSNFSDPGKNRYHYEHGKNWDPVNERPQGVPIGGETRQVSRQGGYHAYGLAVDIDGTKAINWVQQYGKYFGFMHGSKINTDFVHHKGHFTHRGPEIYATYATSGLVTVAPDVYANAYSLSPPHRSVDFDDGYTVGPGDESGSNGVAVTLKTIASTPDDNLLFLRYLTQVSLWALQTSANRRAASRSPASRADLIAATAVGLGESFQRAQGRKPAPPPGGSAAGNPGGGDVNASPHVSSTGDGRELGVPPVSPEENLYNFQTGHWMDNRKAGV